MALNADDTLLNGHYRIIRQLGRGGFGFVYLAQDTLLGEQVAIKELIPALVGDETMLKRFLAEAKATMRLSHDRIVRTHNVFSEGGNYYIVMECMPGGSLEERLREHGPLQVDEAVRIAAQVCEGLSYAHARGVVHCDLKPANILFAADGSAKVADFGIAHVSEEVLTRTWQTPAGFVAGTLPYMSPEQADGVRDDPRIDIYAVGAILYRMLAAKTYLEFDSRETPGATADNVYRIRNQVAKAPSMDNRHVPAWLDEVVLKALAKQPAERYVDADIMRAALLKRTGSEPTPSLPVQATRAPSHPAVASSVPGREAVPKHQASERQRPLPRWFWPLASVSGVLLIAIVISVIALLGKSDGSQQTVPPEPSHVMVAMETATSLPTETNTAASALSTKTIQPTRTLAPTPTPSPALEPTSTAVPTLTPTATATATSRSEPTAEPTTAPTRPPKLTSTPVRSSTSTPVSNDWYWRGNGPFNTEHGVLGIINYTNKILTVRVEGVGVFEVPADAESVLALEVAPQAYQVCVSVPDASEACITAPESCTATDGMKVPAKRALVLPIKQHMEEWGNRVALAVYCPFYEDPDKP